jgi:hypothetical protein
MSLLHRALLASAVQELLRRIEPVAKDVLEATVGVAVPAAAPAIDAVIEVADKTLMPAVLPAPGATTSDHIAAAVAASSAPSAATAPPAPAAAPVASSSPAAAVPNLAAGPAQAAIAACEALALQLANIATQVAALKANITGSSGS